MKTYTLDEMQDKVIGKRGIPRRERFENKLKAFLNRQAKRLLQNSNWSDNPTPDADMQF